MSGSLQFKAEEAFRQARRRVTFQRILGFFTGHAPEALLSLDDVRGKLNVRGQHYAGVRPIRIDQIVGSVGRYQDFNRAFLPTQDYLRERWKRVYETAHGMAGFPPIDVYQVGDVYFVRDGHHRVSVLKELGAPTVEATVTVLETPVRLSPEVTEAELDLKAEYAAFLRETHLDELRPGQDVEFSLPGQYPKLLEHIAVHRHYLGLEQSREIPSAEAVTRWYDEVYLPAVQVIREEQALDQFPGRTEADLYLWVIEHRHYLTEQTQQDVPLDRAAAEFTREFSRGAGRKQLEAEARRAREETRAVKRAAALVAVFGSGRTPEGHPVLAQAERLGRLLAEAGFGLLTGGYGGTMEAVCRGARQAGGTRVVGVTMDLFTPPLRPNHWLTEERRVSDFFPRLQALAEADAFVVLRGGIGTLTEATLMWTLLETGQIALRPFLFVGSEWPRLFDAFRAETFMTEHHFALATIVDDVDRAVTLLKEAFAPTP